MSAVDRAREALEGITPGPWKWDDTGTYMGCGEVYTVGEHVFGGNIAAPSGDCYPRSGYSPKEDMQFIAAAPALVRDLLGVVAAQKVAIEAHQAEERSQRERAEAWHDGDVVRGRLAALVDERDLLTADVDLLRWLHAEADWRVGNWNSAYQALFDQGADQQDALCRVAKLADKWEEWDPRGVLHTSYLVRQLRAALDGESPAKAQEPLTLTLDGGDE